MAHAPELAERLPLDDSALVRLKDNLGKVAEAEGLLNLAYQIVSSPVGELMLVATPRGLVRVAFASEGFDDVLGTLARKLSPRILEAPHRLETAARGLDEYFAGKRQHFDVELDFALSSGFRASVQRYLSSIAYGQTESYRQVAVRVGNPNAVRAVGSACATNPLPIVVPCHRVLRSDGSLGGYLGGLDAKRTLLNLESARRS